MVKENWTVPGTQYMTNTHSFLSFAYHWILEFLTIIVFKYFVFVYMCVWFYNIKGKSTAHGFREFVSARCTNPSLYRNGGFP